MARSLSTDPRDGSSWIADGGNHRVVHVAADGQTTLWSGDDFNMPKSVSVDPTDGSCWVADTLNGRVCLLAPDGTPRWIGTGFTRPVSVSANADDGSCWVADLSSGEIVHLAVLSPGMFSDVPPDHWACAEIEACVNADVVQGYGDGTYQPTVYVTRDQMAVYIARALAGGDENVPDASGDPRFPDVLAGDWGYEHIEYAAAQNVVAGYDDDLYHPEYEVTRDQMAVYVARAMVAPTGEAALADYLPTTPRDFPDVPDTRWGWKHIEYCVEHDVVHGYEDGLYHPADPVTRGQMAVYIARAFGLMS